MDRAPEASKAVVDWSGLGFDRAAIAFTAKGQSIIVEEVAIDSETIAWCVRALAGEWFALVWDFEDLEAPLAQQSWECMEPQTSPDATIVAFAFTGWLLAAVALAMFSQPSMHPAPAIQRATASASATRTILIEEKNLIAQSV